MEWHNGLEDGLWSVCFLLVVEPLANNFISPIVVFPSVKGEVGVIIILLPTWQEYWKDVMKQSYNMLSIVLGP